MRANGGIKMRLPKHNFLFTLALTAGFFLLTNSARAEDWPNYRGPNHDGFTTETDWQSNWPAGGPKILWRKSIGTGFSSIVVNNGRVYTMGNSGKKGDKRTDHNDTVFCFDAQSGKEIWAYSYPCPLEPKYYDGGTLSTPTADGNAVYTLSKMGDLFCLDAATGKIIWQKQVNKDLGMELPTWHFSSSPLVINDMVIFNLGTAGLALNKKTGDIIWQNGKGKCGYATPVPFTLEGNNCLAIFGEDSLIGVKTEDGKRLWDFKWKTKYDVNAADPVISKNYIFISSGYNHGCALIKLTGNNVTKIWANKNIRSQMNCTMLWKGHIYGFDESQLKCLLLRDGSEQWSEKSLGKGSLIMSTDGRMIIMSDKGELVIAQADPTAFKPLARAQILTESRCWTSPTLANGKIYARNANGDMACVDVH